MRDKFGSKNNKIDVLRDDNRVGTWFSVNCNSATLVSNFMATATEQVEQQSPPLSAEAPPSSPTSPNSNDVDLIDASTSTISNIVSWLVYIVASIIFYVSQLGFGMLGLGMCCGYCCKSVRAASVLCSLSSLFQSILVVTLLLALEVYDEIQSWHIAYLTWAIVHASVGLYADCAAGDNTAISLTLKYVFKQSAD